VGLVGVAEQRGDLALSMEGICKRGVPAPPGASRELVVLARLGRAA
jgi:hypothetical protein